MRPKQSSFSTSVLAGFMALLLLFSQTVYAYDSLNVMIANSEDGKPSCHNMLSEHQATTESMGDETSMEDHCKRDCCNGSDSCASHCLSCVSLVGGALMPSINLLQIPYSAAQPALRADQIPGGLIISELYRPPILNRYFA